MQTNEKGLGVFRTEFFVRDPKLYYILRVVAHGKSKLLFAFMPKYVSPYFFKVTVTVVPLPSTEVRETSPS